MIIKYEKFIDWKLLSFLPTLSKGIVDKYKCILDKKILEYFNKNLVE